MNDAWTLIGLYFILCYAFHQNVHIVTSRLVPHVYQHTGNESEDRKKTVSWDYCAASILYCFLIFYLYGRGALEWYSSVEGRWTGVSFHTKHGIALHIASSIYECVCYVLSGKDFVFYLHHAVTLGCLFGMFLSGRGQCWCCIIGLVEGSNVPLGILGVFGAIPALKGSFLYTINGVVLWLMFAIFRLPIPWVMWKMYCDMRDHGPASVGSGVAFVFENPATEQKWVYFLFATALFLWLLSMLWFFQITKGILQAVGLVAADPPSDAKKDK